MTTIEFDKKLTCGPEFVACRIIENNEELKVGSIWLPQNTEANARLAFVKIENVGSKAAEEYGLKEGDYAYIDRLSTFAHTSPVAAVKYNNVICLANESNTEFSPLKNMLFIEPDCKGGTAQVGNILVDKSYEDRLNTGTILKMNCDESLNLPFKVGDKVLLTKGADVVKFGEVELYIYKHDMIVAKIED